MRITFEGHEVDAVEVHPVSVQEPWTTILLEDGNTVKVKIVVTGIIKVLDKVNEDGTPVYIIQSKSVMVAKIPMRRPDPVN